MPTEDDKIIDLPTDGPGAEVILPEETVTEGQQPVDVPETKPEGEVEIREIPAVEEKPAELITEAPVKEEVKKDYSSIDKKISKLKELIKVLESKKK